MDSETLGDEKTIAVPGGYHNVLAMILAPLLDLGLGFISVSLTSNDGRAGKDLQFPAVSNTLLCTISSGLKHESRQ